MPTTPNSIPQLETPRLLLREFRASDLDAYAAMCADAEVMRHIGAGGPVDRANAWRQVAIFNGQWSLEGCGMWAAERKADGVLVGRVGLLNPPDWPALELGWLLGREFWGQGLAREGSAAALRWTLDTLKPKRLISLIRPGNDRSVHLAEALGARRDGEHMLAGQPAWVYAYALST